MSQVPAPRRHDGGAGRMSRAAEQLLMFLAALAAMFGVVPAAQAATAPVTQADMCRAWSATTGNPKISLSNGLNVSATRALRVGTSCLAKNSEIRLTGAKVVDPGPAGPGGTAAAQVLAAIQRVAAADPGLKQGDELFKGAFLTQFNASLKIGYFDINGAVELKFTGGTVSRFLFKGRLYGVDKLSVTVYSPPGGTKLPNIGGTPVMYNGTLTLSGKKYTLNLTGSAPSVDVTYGGETIGVKDATIALNLKDQGDGQRLHADVTGDITVGSAAHVNGKVSADFDDAGLTALSGGGDLSVTIPAKGSSPSGSVSGNAVFAYTKDPLSTQITFTGDVRVGDALVTSASGTLDDNSASFKGDATYTTDLVTAKGAVEGDVFYGDDLSGKTVTNKAGAQVPATKGDLYLKTASADVTAKGITVSGAAQIGNVGDDRWVKASGALDLSFKSGDQPETTVKGNATIDWLVGTTPNVTFDGSVASGSTAVANAKGSLDGQKIALAGDVTLSNPDLTIKGAVDGTVYYGADLTGETIKNHAGTAVAANKGDFFLKTASASITTKGFALSGNASLTRAGTERFASGGGSVDATYNGTNLKGSADIDWVAGGIPSVNFSGAVSNGGVQVAAASGSVDGNKLALKGNATVNSNGFTLKGAIDGLVYYGSDLTGQTITGADGKDVAATKGDFLIKSASADVTGKGIAVSGNASVGKVGTQIWAKGGGSVDLTYGATNLKGSASASWVNGSVPAVTFSGSLTNGSTVVANASGAFDGAKIAIKGDASFTDAGATIKGAVDGVVYYGADLSAEKVKNRAGADVTPLKGDYVLKSATGSVVVKGLTLTGGIGLSSVAGEKWATTSGTIDATYGTTTIKGTASAAWVNGGDSTVSFDGTVTSGNTVVTGKGTIDGKKIQLSGSAQTTASGITLKGAVDGVVFYGADLTGEKVTNKAGAQVQATKGDLYLKSVSADVTTQGLTFTGAATIGSVGTDKWIKGGGSIDATYNGTQIKGSADVDWTVGTTPTISFSGSLANGGVTIAQASGTLDPAKIALKGSATVSSNGFTLKGSVDGVVYYGSDLTGVTIKGRDGKDVPATKGDFLVKSASADITAKSFSLTGNASLGKVGGAVWANGGGSVDLTYGATNLKGSATADWVLGSIPTVTFDGTLTNGTTAVANASGAFDGAKIALKGDASLTDPNLTLKGAVEGTLYYGADLSAEKVKNRAGADVTPAKGDFVLKSASGSVVIKGLSLSGNLSLSSVAGEKWATAGGAVDFTQNGTTVKGTASASWVAGGDTSVSFDGTVTSGDTVITGKGTIDGKKIAITGSAQTIAQGVSVKGAVDGVVFYGNDLTGEKVTNRAGAQVQATKGDLFLKSVSATITGKGFTVTGAATVGSVGTEKWVKGGGSVDATYGTATLKGSADVDWVAGTTPSITFNGTATIGSTILASASGTVDGAKIALKANASVTDPNFTFKGAVDGVLYYGADLSGEEAKNRAGADVTPAKGDFVVKGASVDITAKGLALSGAGNLAQVGGELWASGSGSVDATYGASKVTGSATASWVKGQIPSVTFKGGFTNGTTTVANAEGTIDGKKIALKGDLSLTDPAFTVKAAVDGVLYYGADLSGETAKSRTGASVQPVKGDYVLSAASVGVTVKNLAVTGDLSLASLAGEKWATVGGSIDATYNGTTIKGSATASWIAGGAASLSFDGTVTSGDTKITGKGTIDGNKIAIAGSAQTSNANLSLKGAVDGVVFYGSDLSGEKVKNRAGADVTPVKGDFLVKSASADVTVKGVAVSGAFSLGSVGGEKWVKGSGSIDATYGATNVKGSASVDWLVGTIPTVTFSGSVTSGTTVLANASGTLDPAKIALKADASVTDPNFTLKGAIDGVVYYGADLSAEKVTNRAGAQVTPAKGDFVVKSASAALTAKGLAVSGAASLSSIGGDVWASGSGSVDATYGTAKVNGSATVAWVKGQVPSVTFKGGFTNGTTTVANAEGTIDGKKIALKGDLALTDPNLTLKAAVDGVLYYGADLTGETATSRTGASVQPAKGDYVLKAASVAVTVKNLAVTGNLTLGSLAGEKWATVGGSIDTTYNGTSIKGSASVAWIAGQVPSVTFDGTISSGDTVITGKGTIDGNKIAIAGSAQTSNANLSIKGAVDGVVYYGNDLSGEKVKNRAGADVTPAKGDFVIKSASATVVAKGLTVSGNVSLGKVGTDIWAKGDGSIDLTYGATNLKGSASVDWTYGQIPSVTFAGSLTSGTALVANASGALDGKKIQLKGDATVTDGSTTLKGAVDGVVFYGADLAGQTIADKSGALVEPLKGDYNFKGLSGSVDTKGLSASLGIAFGNVRGVKWLTGGGAVDIRWTNPGQPENRIQGQANIDANGVVQFSGSYSAGDIQMATATGTADGKKLTISGQLTTPTASGKATGVLYYGTDLSGETVKNKAGATVAASRGDFSLKVTDGRVTLKQLVATATFSANKVGGNWWVNAAAQVKVGSSWLAFTGDVDSSGDFVLKGQGSIVLDGYHVDFNGTALVRDNRFVLDGTVAIVTNLFKVQLTGTIEKPNMDVNTYVFTGKASFKFGAFQVADATVRLTVGEGLATTFSIKTCFLFICPNATYKLYFNDGTLARAELNAPIAWVAQFLAIGAVAMGPNVPIATSITGII